MKIGRNMILAVLLTFCVTATLVMAIPIQSQSTTKTYDPWIDYNDDGKISLLDLVSLANHYDTTGDPINKTELLIQVNATYASLLDKIAYLNSTCSNLQSEVDSLNATMNDMNATITALNSALISNITDIESQLTYLNATVATKLGQPDYDSGYFQINQSQSIILSHNLNTTDALVYMVGYNPFSVPYIHQIDYGGEKNGVSSWGTYWSELTATTIKVTRNGNDANWLTARVMIWKVYK